MENPLLNFIDQALADKTNTKLIFEFHELDSGQVGRLLEFSGHDLSGFRRVLDSFAVKHIFKHHGNHEVELQRGQIGVVREDFLLIEQILTGHEEFLVGTSGIGNVMFQYKLEFESFCLVFAEEIRAKRKELAVLTFYKQKIRKR